MVEEHIVRVDEDDCLTTKEELLVCILTEAPQYRDTAIPGPFLDACMTVLQSELKQRDKALKRLQKLLKDCREGKVTPGYEE